MSPRLTRIFLATGLVFFGAMVLPGISTADSDTLSVESRLVKFDQNATGTAPRWDLTGSGDQTRTLSYNLPGLTVHRLEAEGSTWQTLEIEGANLLGDTGAPGLPMTSRLVAVPPGFNLSVQVISSSRTILPDLRLYPVQDPGTDRFDHAGEAYRSSQLDPTNQPRVLVGKPAIMAGQTVVPLMIQPVQYDGTGSRAVVFTDIELQLEFVSDPSSGAGLSARPDRVPQSFAKQMSGQVLGYGDAAEGAALSQSGAGNGLGTYVAVHSGDPGLIEAIAPLLQWRREQGYHVVELSTGLIGSSAPAIKAALLNIYTDTSIPPLEFVSIFGDVSGSYAIPSWYENLSGYHGGGDHYYTTLDGDDILADAHIGRVSVLSSTELNNVIGKILGYEQSPPMAGTSWFGRACLQGDPSASGITTIFVNQWLKGQLMANGWSHVDTTWSGNFANEMLASVGQGVSAYGYRGYIGTSGISNGHVVSLTNGGRLPMAILPTCDSGSFASDLVSRSEAWLRAPNGGAVAAIGTATSGTHTRYNNCYYVSTWDDLINGPDHRIGVAHTGGKIGLFNGYYLAEPHTAEIWAVWNNVMGDPATEIWTGVPRDLQVTHPSQISLGAQAVTLDVEHAGLPVAGARVCLYQSTTDTQVSGLTDDNGRIVLNVPALAAGSVAVTVTGHDLLPYRSGLTVGQVDIFCGATGRLLDDGGDGVANPGEALAFNPLLTNHGATDAFGVSAVVTVMSGPATISGGSLSYGTITAGSENAAAAAAQISVAADAEDGATIRLLVLATDGQDVWSSILEESVVAPAFSVADVDVASFGGSLDPGESGLLEVVLANVGSLTAPSTHATLSTTSRWVTILDDSATFGNIAPGGQGRDLLSPFQVSVAPNCFGGHLATFELAVEYGSGLQATVGFAVPVGEADTDQPTGPDAYGYFAFDNTDLVADLAPTFNWVALDPEHGGPGTDLQLDDFGWEQDDTKTVSLPFSFSFYGQEYDTISICSNGWLAMGETPLNFYRNFPLPAPHSAGSLIAPFWDNLYQQGSGRVYTWYDETGHRFIIQWYELLNDFSNSPQNFEVILLDPQHHPTNTGDGMILFQYAEVHNTDSRDGYATVGIQNADRTVGLNYSFWNQYAPGAANLVANRAILFAPMAILALPDLDVSPLAIDRTLAAGQQVTEYLHITNQGDAGSLLSFNVGVLDPATVAGPVAMAAQSGPVGDEIVVDPNSLANSTVTTSAEEFAPGATLDIPLLVSCWSPDQERLARVELDLPPGVAINSATALDGPNGDIAWNQETGDGALTSWGHVGIGSSQYLANGQAGHATVNLTFSSDLADNVTIPWSLIGDNTGSNPHQVSGTLTLIRVGPFVQVTQPASGQTAVLGEDLVVSFVAGGPLAVDVAIQREQGGPWETLAADLPANASPWHWTVAGEPGPYAVIRVSDTGDETVAGTSGVFQVSRNLDWLQLETASGQVFEGQTLDLALTLDTNGLEPGLHEALVQVYSNAGPVVNVPVNLTVSGATPAGALPSVVALLGNHPNPFNPQTLISFSLPRDLDVNLKVYSVRGRLVRSLLKGPQPAGLHRVPWNGTDDQGHGVASGVYFYRLEAGGEEATGKMTLTK